MSVTATFVRVHGGRLAQFAVAGVGKVYVTTASFPDKQVPQSLDVTALGLREPSPDAPAVPADADKAAAKAAKAAAKAEAIKAKAEARIAKAQAMADKQKAAAEAAMARAAKLAEAASAAAANAGEGQPEL